MENNIKLFKNREITNETLLFISAILSGMSIGLILLVLESMIY